MKKLLYTSILIYISLISCNDDFLERYPEDEVFPESFFETEDQLNTYINSLYQVLPTTSVLFDDFSSDNVEMRSFDIVVAGQHNVTSDATEAGWTWDDLRNINFFLENIDNNPDLDEAIRNHYEGIARFFRAWFYFEKVQRFGDVPWYDNSLIETDDGLYKPRDPRKMVITNILSDLDFAIENVRENTPANTINKWCALALKSRIGLFEGTYEKYHNIGDGRFFLEESIDASNQLMEAGIFSLYSTGNPETDYQNLFIAEDAITSEVILASVFDQGLEVQHSGTNQFISTTLSTPGLTKSFVNTYLMSDGSRFTDKPNYTNLTFDKEMLDRDPRLAQTIRTPGYKRLDGDKTLIPDFNNAATGYQITKYVLGSFYDVNFSVSTNDLPLLRYSEVLLNFAEAKAELEQLSQEDLDRSINLIRRRVSMPDMILDDLTIDPVLSNRYPNVTGSQQAAILEIRRERRVELAIEGQRYQDLMRWRVGDLLAETFQGMYIAEKGLIDLDGDNIEDIYIGDIIPDDKIEGIQYLKLGEIFELSDGDFGNIIVHPDLVKTFDPNKHYLFPLPLTELLLSNNLVQNPGW